MIDLVDAKVGILWDHLCARLFQTPVMIIYGLILEASCVFLFVSPILLLSVAAHGRADNTALKKLEYTAELQRRCLLSPMSSRVNGFPRSTMRANHGDMSKRNVPALTSSTHVSDTWQ